MNVVLVIIDSLSGYLSAMPEERFLTTHLHELLTYKEIAESPRRSWVG